MPSWLPIPPSLRRGSSSSSHGDGRSDNSSVAAEEREGLFVLAPVEHHDTVLNVDVVAVHGLQGHYQKTWTENGKLWLRDFLPRALPAARIMSFGYNSAVMATKSIAGIDEFARQLLEGLEQKRKGGAEARPIVFICHSLGGIVVKKALIIAHADSPAFYQTIIENVRGVVFMGVPHRGAAIADLGSFFASVLKATTAGRVNSALLKNLKRGSKPLQEISQLGVQRLSNLAIRSFYETEKFKSQLIVDEDSVRLNLGNEKVIPLAANHTNICKFSSAESKKYELVEGAICQLIETVTPKVDPANVKLTESEKACLQALYNVDPNAAKELLPSRAPDTCAWIWKDRVFQHWLHGDGPNLLWISGPAGCGKSMISSFLVDNFKAQRPSSTVCFYFSDDKDVERNTAEALLRSIVYQLLDARPRLIKHALRYFEKRGARAFEELNVLWRICLHCFEDPSLGSLVCILDALDECQESGRDHLLGWVKKYTDQKPTECVKLLLTSRPQIDIEDCVNDPGIRLQLEQSHEAHLEKDIERVVTHEIQHMPVLQKWSDERKAQLRQTLLKNSGKTFLWVSLVLQMLPHNPAASDDAFKNHLTSLPDGILEVYTRMLDQIPYRVRNQAKVMLEIIVAARRPLSLEELGQCFRISSTDRSLANLQYQPNFTRTVHHLCRNFVRIINNHCYLVHQSAKEYLQSATPGDRKKADAPPLWFHTTPAQATASLAMRCIWFLSLEDFSATKLASHLGEGKRKNLVIKSPRLFRGSNVIPLPDALDEVFQGMYKNHPFLKYAIHFWADHYREAEILETASCQAAVLRLYRWNLTVRAHWLVKIHRLSHTKIEKLVHWVAPALFCAYNGHMTIMPDLYEDQPAIEPLAQLGYSVFHMAVAGKHLAMVDWLLHTNADVEARDSFGRTSLHVAARGNDKRILNRLLEHGADLAARDGAGKTPQRSAEEWARHSHAEILRLYGKGRISPINDWVQSQSVAPSLMMCPSPRLIPILDPPRSTVDHAEWKPEFPIHRTLHRVEEIRAIIIRSPSNSASGTVTITSQSQLYSHRSCSTDDSDEKISLSTSVSPSQRSYGHPAPSSIGDHSSPTPDFAREPLGKDTTAAEFTSMISAQILALGLQGDVAREALAHRDQGL